MDTSFAVDFDNLEQIRSFDRNRLKSLCRAHGVKMNQDIADKIIERLRVPKSPVVVPSPAHRSTFNITTGSSAVKRSPVIYKKNGQPLVGILKKRPLQPTMPTVTSDELLNSSGDDMLLKEDEDMEYLLGCQLERSSRKQPRAPPTTRRISTGKLGSFNVNTASPNGQLPANTLDVPLISSSVETSSMKPVADVPVEVPSLTKSPRRTPLKREHSFELRKDTPRTLRTLSTQTSPVSNQIIQDKLLVAEPVQQCTYTVLLKQYDEVLETMSRLKLGQLYHFDEDPKSHNVSPNPALPSDSSKCSFCCALLFDSRQKHDWIAKLVWSSSLCGLILIQYPLLSTGQLYSGDKKRMRWVLSSATSFGGRLPKDQVWESYDETHDDEAWICHACVDENATKLTSPAVRESSSRTAIPLIRRDDTMDHESTEYWSDSDSLRRGCLTHDAENTPPLTHHENPQSKRRSTPATPVQTSALPSEKPSTPLRQSTTSFSSPNIINNPQSNLASELVTLKLDARLTPSVASKPKRHPIDSDHVVRPDTAKTMMTTTTAMMSGTGGTQFERDLLAFMPRRTLQRTPPR